MLKTITNFFSYKSIKLSDSFEVLITLKNGNEPISLYNCTGFTIPKLEYEEEVLSYGNLSQVFQTPKYDSCKELTLEFIEMMDKNKKTNKDKHMVVLSKIFEYMGFETKQLFANGELQRNFATYRLNKIIPTIEIKILSNNLWRYEYKYHFGNLKIVNYSIYNLDYQNESPCKVTVTLSFETYYKQTIYEPVEYGVKLEKQKDPISVQNGNDNADTIFNEGVSKAHKEDIENNWRQSLKQSDLDMMNEEPLYDPAFGELPDLDELDLEDSSPVSNPPVQEIKVSSNEHIGQQTGGYRGPQGPTSNPNPTKIKNVNK